MSLLWLIVGLVVAQRLGEMALARRNTQRLLAQGGIEVGAGHYPLFVLLHAGWLLSLVLFVPANQQPSWGLLAIYLALQPLRIWIIASLGTRWTTRIIVLPGGELVRRGPYRLLRHPNYLLVVCEIALLPLAFAAWETALVFSTLNAALLAWRIKVESAALQDAGPS